MAEEIEDASVIVPKAMMWSFLLNVPFTFVLLVTYLFCITDIDAALASSSDFPFIWVFQNALNSNRGTSGFVIVVLVLLVMITISSLASTSRQTFAFVSHVDRDKTRASRLIHVQARDNGMPFSHWLGRVHPRWQIPVNSILFTCAFTMAISLINIGSSVAFNAILSLSTVALMATYVISIGCVTLKRYRLEALPPARWSLGRMGMPVNCVALAYACWSFFWSFWPNQAHVTATNFNWACVLFVGLMGIAGALYAFHARHVYEGPVVKVEGREYR
ncbi:hypothetical protein LTR28_010562 [Elasticomyces elasticus]|nr:hypothetical protein LTR28_010562 [Elasticomyces elasticus]